jgi:hypothetical protein
MPAQAPAQHSHQKGFFRVTLLPSSQRSAAGPYDQLGAASRLGRLCFSYRRDTVSELRANEKAYFTVSTNEVLCVVAVTPLLDWPVTVMV